MRIALVALGLAYHEIATEQDMTLEAFHRVTAVLIPLVLLVVAILLAFVGLV